MNGTVDMIKALVEMLNDAKLDGKTGEFGGWASRSRSETGFFEKQDLATVWKVCRLSVSAHRAYENLQRWQDSLTDHGIPPVAKLIRAER